MVGQLDAVSMLHTAIAVEASTGIRSAVTVDELQRPDSSVTAIASSSVGCELSPSTD